MTQQQQPVSFFADDLAEGGGPPIQQNLRIQNAAFVDFNYGGRSPMVTALKVDFLTDAGNQVTQHYSCGDPGRVGHTPDGRRLTAQPTKNSNFGILMVALSNAGFPQHLLESGDIAVIVGLYAYWDGQTVNRAGLPGREGQANSNSVVAVPTVIHQMPGQQPTGPMGGAAPGMPAPGMPAPGMSGGAPAPGMPAPGMPGAGGGTPAPGMPAPGTPGGGGPDMPGAGMPAAGGGPDMPAPGASSPNGATVPAGAPVPGMDPNAGGMPGVGPALGTPMPGTPAPGMPAPGAAPGAPAVDPTMQSYVSQLVATLPPEFAKQDLMAKVFEVYGTTPAVRDALSSIIFDPICDQILGTLGYGVNGNNVTRAAGVA